MKVDFTEIGIKEYFEWQNQDKKTLKKINELIKDIQRNGLGVGIGKPEPLKHIKAFSRKIDDANRLVYIGNENQDLEIISCKGHYED
jgi:toxin YoeB